VIVNGTNDGWFAWCDYGREQHLQVTRWRSLETATPTIRAANTGISAHIDAMGRIVKAGVDQERRSTGVDGVLTGTVNLGTGSTVYGRVGPIFQWVALAGAGLVLLRSVMPRGAGKAG
jgi:apolipoprotein N-acyltransferase